MLEIHKVWRCRQWLVFKVIQKLWWLVLCKCPREGCSCDYGESDAASKLEVFPMSSCKFYLRNIGVSTKMCEFTCSHYLSLSLFVLAREWDGFYQVGRGHLAHRDEAGGWAMKSQRWLGMTFKAVGVSLKMFMIFHDDVLNCLHTPSICFNLLHHFLGWLFWCSQFCFCLKHIILCLPPSDQLRGNFSGAQNQPGVGWRSFSHATGSPGS